MPPDCADPELDFRRLFRKDGNGGVPARFSGRNVHYSANARAAIRRACDILGLGPGCEVLAPAYNCGSEIDPMIDAGAVVVFYDTDRSANVAVDDVARRITPRTRAIYVTHYFGFRQPRIADIQALCKARGLYLIEDCALAVFWDSASPAPGTFGDVAVYCFYKFFPVAAGGALVINTPGLGAGQGFSRPAPARLAAKPVLRAAVRHIMGARALRAVKTGLGRCRHDRRGAGAGKAPAPSDGAPDMPGDYYFDPAFRDAGISAFARYPLRSFNVARCIAARRRNYLDFLQVFGAGTGIVPLYPELPAGVCPLSFPVLVGDRDRICAELNRAGIPATPWWAGYHRGLSWEGFENARFLKGAVLSLPCHQYLDGRHVSHISEVLKAVVSGGKSV